MTKAQKSRGLSALALRAIEPSSAGLLRLVRDWLPDRTKVTALELHIRSPDAQRSNAAHPGCGDYATKKALELLPSLRSLHLHHSGTAFGEFLDLVMVGFTAALVEKQFGSLVELSLGRLGGGGGSENAEVPPEDVTAA